MRSKAFLFSFVVLCASNVAAGALSWSTQMNCYSDYYAYCSKHTAGSAGCHACMRANRARLSSACVSALIGDGVLKDANAVPRQAKIAGAAKARAPRAPRRSVTASVANSDAKTPSAKAAGTPPPMYELSVAKAEPQVPAEPPPRAPEPSAMAPEQTATPEQPAAQQAAKRAPNMDQGTFEALKNRGPHFVVQEDIASIFSRSDEKPRSPPALPHSR